MRIEVLLRRAQPGSHRSVQQHIRRAQRLHDWITERFGVREPYQYRAKHLRYALEHGTAGLAASTRYDYWRTARVLAAAIGKWPDWEPHLRGPWTAPHLAVARPSLNGACTAGGRPPKLPHTRRRSSQ
jgi:hypothetical protein